MARIRTIKPEFPHSQSMGRVSREARLLFILLWTLCDDSGRTRAASRMLASLLYPYDDDAPLHIEGWLDDLEHERCIIRYDANGTSYLQVCKWLDHQKIDKPSKSKIPEFVERSRKIAKPLEPSSEDQRIKDQGRDKDLGPSEDKSSDAKAASITSQSNEVSRETKSAATVSDVALLDEVPLFLVTPTDGDWAKVLFRQGLNFIAAVIGKTPAYCRPIIGKWLKLSGDDHHKIFELLVQAQRDSVADLRGWMEARLKMPKDVATKTEPAVLWKQLVGNVKRATAENKRFLVPPYFVFDNVRYGPQAFCQRMIDAGEITEDEGRYCGWRPVLITEPQDNEANDVGTKTA